jgi:glycosyltransferase involved in cell wall biosynthesis
VDPAFFSAEGGEVYQPGRRMKVVTHHWSNGFAKGWDIYERLDHLLGVAPFGSLFEFTYIGRLPWGATLSNAQHVDVLDGQALAAELRRHHLYLTASRNEAAGNHFLEGMQCGLPVLFLRSGGTPEYCEPYGIGFSPIDFEEKLLEAIGRYDELRGRVLGRDYPAQAMAEEYLNLFERITATQAAKRTYWAQAAWSRARLTVRQVSHTWRGSRRAA